MKSKSRYLFQVFFVLLMLFAPMGGVRYAQAGANLARQPDAIVITHDLSFWNAIYIGFVDDTTYEKWQFEFTESHNFVVSATPVMNTLTPLLVLLDENGDELARSPGTLVSAQPAGNYSIQVQPQSGSGFYVLTLREAVQTQPFVLTVISPTSVKVGETAVATVNLGNVPAGGYTSAEFTCTYNATLGSVSNIAVTNLFGADPAVAISGPQNGSFIVAVAGSNGNKAIANGAAFAFSVKGLQAGQISIDCKARVSKGDNVLTGLPSVVATLTVTGVAPTPTFTPTRTATATPTRSITPTGLSSSLPTFTATITKTATPASSSTAATSTPTSLVTSISTSTPLPTFTPLPTLTLTTTLTALSTSTPLPTFTPLPTATKTFTPIASPTPLPSGQFTGKVLAGKPVTISLYKPDNTLLTSVIASPDGTFSLTASIGTYRAVATASGYLAAQGSVTLSAGTPATLPTVSLLAGDIDNNNVVDQLDALTLGMNYGAATPAAADLNNDAAINVLDLELLARNYRKTGPVAW